MQPPNDDDDDREYPLDLYPAWRQAVEDARKTFSYGDVIPNEWLLEHFRLPTPKTINEYQQHQFELLRSMDRFRETLLTKYKMALKNRRAYGYEVVPPKDQSAFAMQTLKREVGRQLIKTQRLLTHVNERLLDVAAAQYHAEQLAKLAALKAMTRKSLRDAEPERIGER